MTIKMQDINDFVTSMDNLSSEAARIAEEHGFKENTVGEDAALMVSEVSEMLEDYRANKGLNEVWYERLDETRKIEDEDTGDRVIITRTLVSRKQLPGYKPCGIPSELADAVIRIMHFSHRHGINLGAAIIEKMEFNETRPFKHGNKVI